MVANPANFGQWDQFRSFHPQRARATAETTAGTTLLAPSLLGELQLESRFCPCLEGPTYLERAAMHTQQRPQHQQQVPARNNGMLSSASLSCSTWHRERIFQHSPTMPTTKRRMPSGMRSRRPPKCHSSCGWQRSSSSSTSNIHSCRLGSGTLAQCLPHMPSALPTVGTVPLL